MADKLHTSPILQQAHDRMKRQFLDNSAQQDIQQAKTLESFLRELKIRAADRNRDTSDPARSIQEKAIDAILDNVKLPNGRTLHNLFRRTGKSSYAQGMYFEQDFAAIILGILRTTGDTKTKLQDINIGADVGVTGYELDKMLESITEDLQEELLEKTEEEIKNKKLPYVFGKIDTVVSGNIINMNASVDIPQNILDALSNATFTDKSYRSETWREGKKVEVGNKTITLGNSDIYRALMGSMSYLGFSKQEAHAIYYGGRAIMSGSEAHDGTDPEIIKKHIYHLRYLYELTGVGIYYKTLGDSLSGGAKFMVYNDPSSDDITVVSTKQIIQDLLSDKVDTPSNPFGKIGIEKMKLTQLSKS